MRGLAFWFMLCGVVAVLIGMAWGLRMAATHDHTMMPAHAHLNLVGFVSFAIFAFYYHLVPDAAEGRLPRLHLALSLLGLTVMVPGIALALQERTEALAAGGATISALGMLCFLTVVLRGARTA
ncbi:MAG: hypothetical protein M5U35_12120 [Roseovarius sp.]|nr:hypothetical protein [Roseovarius sp.]